MHPVLCSMYAISLSRTSSHDPWVSNIACPPRNYHILVLPLPVDTDFLITIGTKEPCCAIPFMKLYDLIILIFSFLLNFKGFEVSKIAKLLVAVGKTGDLVVRTPGCYTTILTFFLLFFPCLSFNSSVPLVHNAGPDIIEI